MKIVHVASGDAWGGAEKVLVLLVNAFRQQSGVHVQALLLNEGRLAAALRDLDVQVHVISESEHTLPRLTLAARRWLKSAQADVVHAHRYKEAFIAALAAIPYRRGLVVTVHGLEPRAQLTRSRLRRTWGSLLAARVMGARFVGVSRELTHRLQRRLGAKAVVNIPNPMPIIRPVTNVPDLRRRFGWNPSRPLVGFVGRLERVKGPDRFLDLAARHGGDAAFVLIGTGSLEREMHERVKTQGLAERVVFTGEVPDATGYLKQFDLLALPSRHEGFPMILLEAAACEVPAVAFDVGGVAEVLSGSPVAWLIKAGETELFEETLDKLLQNRDDTKLAAVQWAARVRARFDRTAIISAYMAVYRAAVAKAGHLAARRI